MLLIVEGKSPDTINTISSANERAFCDAVCCYNHSVNKHRLYPYTNHVLYTAICQRLIFLLVPSMSRKAAIELLTVLLHLSLRGRQFLLIDRWVVSKPNIGPLDIFLQILPSWFIQLLQHYLLSLVDLYTRNARNALRSSSFGIEAGFIRNIAMTSEY